MGHGTGATNALNAVNGTWTHNNACVTGHNHTPQGCVTVLNPCSVAMHRCKTRARVAWQWCMGVKTTSSRGPRPGPFSRWPTSSRGWWPTNQMPTVRGVLSHCVCFTCSTVLPAGDIVVPDGTFVVLMDGAYGDTGRGTFRSMRSDCKHYVKFPTANHFGPINWNADTQGAPQVRLVAERSRLTQPPVQTASCSARVHFGDDPAFSIAEPAQDQLLSLIASVTTGVARAALLNDTMAGPALVQTLAANGLGDAVLKTSCLGL